MTAISVIVPVHNGAGFYASAVQTILAQECAEIEIVVVDDGSTDEIAACVAATPGAVLLQQQQHGPAAARNAGIARASAGLIAFLDVDDLWTEGHLCRLSAALAADPQAGFAQGRMQQFTMDEDGRWVLSGAYHMPYLGSCLFRRETLEQRGGLDESMAMGEDYDLMLRCWENDVTRAGVAEVSLLYRRHAGNMTRGKNNRANLVVLQRRMQRVRAGVLNPDEPRRFAFGSYVGDVSGFATGDLGGLDI